MFISFSSRKVTILLMSKCNRENFPVRTCATIKGKLYVAPGACLTSVKAEPVLQMQSLSNKGTNRPL